MASSRWPKRISISAHGVGLTAIRKPKSPKCWAIRYARSSDTTQAQNSRASCFASRCQPSKTVYRHMNTRTHRHPTPPEGDDQTDTPCRGLYVIASIPFIPRSGGHATYRSVTVKTTSQYSFQAYCAALERAPRTTIEEYREAETNPMLATIIIDRDRRLNGLWRRWTGSDAPSWMKERERRWIEVFDEYKASSQSA